MGRIGIVKETRQIPFKLQSHAVTGNEWKQNWG